MLKDERVIMCEQCCDYICDKISQRFYFFSCVNIHGHTKNRRKTYHEHAVLLFKRVRERGGENFLQNSNLMYRKKLL